MRGKYVIIESDFDAKRPVILNNGQSHNSMFDMYGRQYRVISAGSFVSNDGKFHCYGESESLKLKANEEEDSRILNIFFECNDY